MAHVEQAPGRPVRDGRRAASSGPIVRTGAWLAHRHSLAVEVVTVLGLYAIYEASRGLVVGRRDVALAHADDVAALERHLHIFVESDIQHAARSVPGLVAAFGLAYLTLHLAVTGGYLLWLHQRRPAAFPFIRTTLLVASALALVGFLLFPTAPPRLTGLGIADTISGDHVNLNKGLVSSLYNPYAAVPSMHAGFAVVVAVSLFREARRRIWQVLGVLYPALVLLIIVATGNHFFVDAVAGVATVGVAALLTALLIGRGRGVDAAPRAERRPVETLATRRSAGLRAAPGRVRACGR